MEPNSLKLTQKFYLIDFKKKKPTISYHFFFFEIPTKLFSITHFIYVYFYLFNSNIYKVATVEFKKE